MGSHCGFNLHLSDISDIEHFLICLLAICMSSWQKCLFGSFAHFFNWIVCLPGVELYEFFLYFGNHITFWGKVLIIPVGVICSPTAWSRDRNSFQKKDGSGQDNRCLQNRSKA